MALHATTKMNNQTDIDVSVETDESSVVDEEENKKMPVFKPLYAYFVLLLVVVCRIIVMWHRAGLSYSYGYAGVGA